MKKILSLLLLSSLILVSANTSVVSAKKSVKVQEFEDSLDLSKEEKERLMNLGFTEEQIKYMTEDEYEHLKGQKGKVIETETIYLQLEPGKKPKKVSEDEALKGVKEYKEKKEKEKKEKEKKGKKSKGEVSAKVITSDTEETSWMKVKLYVTQREDEVGERTGSYKFKYDWEWLVEPNFELTDAIAITHPEFIDNIVGSEYNSYRAVYSAAGTRKSVTFTSRSADKKNSNGMAFKVDLITSYNSFDVYEHEGYMYYDGELNNWNYSSATAYGHYTHVEGDILGMTLNLVNGNLSVSGVLKTTEMTDVGVNFKTHD
ncbi:hypothetical protein [Brevibacillus migulae]|uniref:hypothetical protein n=1 Tax=Brevibacillus migulae TaxID=1644114 RepID=UPI00106EA80B|nr:hypothetical protein [Brevibacillus migulae]